MKVKDLKKVTNVNVNSEKFNDLKSYFKNNFKDCAIEISHVRVDELPFYSDRL